MGMCEGADEKNRGEELCRSPHEVCRTTVIHREQVPPTKNGSAGAIQRR